MFYSTEHNWFVPTNYVSYTMHMNIIISGCGYIRILVYENKAVVLLSLWCIYLTMFFEVILLTASEYKSGEKTQMWLP